MRSLKIIKYFNKLVLFFLIIGLFFPVASWGFGLSVDPEVINLENIPLGEKVSVANLGGDALKLKITNKGGSLYGYSIKILYTAVTANSLKAGYEDIPDIFWIEPEKKEIKLLGNGSTSLDIFIKVPNNDNYADKKYQAIVEVKNKKNNPEETIVLACQIPIRFSTVKSVKKSPLKNLLNWISSLGAKKE